MKKYTGVIGILLAMVLLFWLNEDGSRTGYQTVKLKVLTGEKRGTVLEANSSSAYLYGADCQEGMLVVAVLYESGDLLTASVYGYCRIPGLLAGVGLFFAAILWVGRKQGAYSILGLGFTFLCIIFVFLPMVYRGYSPILAAVCVTVLTTVVTMRLVAGRTKKAYIASMGTIFGVMTAGIMAFLISLLTKMDGYNVSDVESMVYIEQSTGIQVGELLFAGILIAALGAVMDVAMSVTSAVFEIGEKQPELSAGELMKSGMNIGRDVIGTMTNTLILAFTGGAINNLVSIYAYDYGVLQVF